MTTTQYKGDVCSIGHSFALDNFIRKIFQNPKKIVGSYINPGDTVIDLGCGPGFFSIEMARMVGSMGNVIAVDLQKEMLEKVKAKTDKYDLYDRMTLHQCNQYSLGIKSNVKADFILAFYMLHETPDQKHFLNEAKSLLKENGKFLIVEPLFHVSKKKFNTMIEDMKDTGFKILDKPSKKGGRSLLLSL